LKRPGTCVGETTMDTMTNSRPDSKQASADKPLNEVISVVA